MNKLIRYAFLMGLVAFSLSSCNDDDNLSSKFELTSITTTTDFDTPLSSCNLGDWIVLHGTGLDNVSEIDVNGVKVNLRNSFLEPTKITLQVPRALPENGNPTNAISITNGSESLNQSIAISIPDLIIKGLDNEWAAVGDTVKLLGSNFDIYDITFGNGHVLFASSEAKITETAEDFVKVIVPTGAKKGDKVKVQSKGIDVLVPGQYCDDRNMIETFDAGFGWAGTDGLVTDGTNQGDVPACNGKYLRIAREHDGGWFCFIANAVMFPEEMWNNPEEWCMKFEIVTQIPINEKFIQFDQTHYKWEPWNVTEFDTYGDWKTITLEMTDVLFEGYTQDPTAAFLFQLSLNGGSNEKVDFGIDNFRLYKKE